MYKVVVSKNAQEDLENIINYCDLIAAKVAANFVESVSEIFKVLESNPFFQSRYKNKRAISVNKFPYLAFFEIVENIQIAKVLSIFHTFQNHDKYPL